MKKQKDNKISRIFIKQTIIVLWILVITFAIIATISIFGFARGSWFKGQPNPFGGYLLAMFSLFCLVLFVIYVGNAKVGRAIKELENATERVARGDFDVEVALTGNEDIDSYIENFNQMVHELKGIETLKEDFISNVSHEFKTPLSVIQSYSKALRHDNLDADTRAQYEKILDDNIKKLSNLTTNILNLSRLENQETSLSKSEFLLDEQLRQCILSLEPAWAQKNINFSLDLPSTKYVGFEELIAQVWQNIISNAIKFSDTNGNIDIKLFNENDIVCVEIKDYGIGMDEETKSKIFDKFYQGDTSHSKDGNGLGLALVKRILHICNGKIDVDSAPNAGTTFTVSLPTTSQ